MGNVDATMDRIRALDYLHKTNGTIREAKSMVNSIIKLGGAGDIEISASGSSMERQSVKIDAAAIANAKSILRGLRALEKEGRK
ncbi:MAG: hypothetical protein JNG85_03350 [Spirochaetaceae bacterium]|nr:hypothetical protein [Spirochaetaceae bacterium]